MEPSKLIQLFTGYGLTKSQAKVLTTLNQTNGTLNVQQISKSSNIARESIYKILLDIKERGLIQQSITKPKKYTSIPLKRILTLLSEEKNEEIRKLEILKKQALIDDDHKPEVNHVEDKSHFVLIPKKIQLVHKISQSLFNSKKNVKITTSWKRHLQSMSVYEKALKTLIANGAKFQVYITMKTTQNQIPEKAKFFHDSPNVSIKFVDTPTKIILVIVDDQEVFLMTEPNLDLVESPALWSSNQSLITALTTCFDSIWQKS